MVATAAVLASSIRRERCEPVGSIIRAFRNALDAEDQADVRPFADIHGHRLCDLAHDPHSETAVALLNECYFDVPTRARSLILERNHEEDADEPLRVDAEGERQLVAAAPERPWRGTELAVSRKREFLADASGALLTRYPEGLISALRKIGAYSQPMRTASTATAHLYISNPFGPAAATALMARDNAVWAEESQ